ncbi:MAG: class I SAM-dependent methyltransferase [Minisyncoccia bacterium]
MSISKQSKEIRVTKAYYEKNADVWTKTHSDSFHDEKEFRCLKEYINPKATVIDIGCAAGVLVPLFLGIGKGLRYSGLDIAKKFITIASRRYPHLPFTEGDIADRTTLPTKKFDAFIARSVLMHLPLPLWDTAFENIEHLTKHGAYGYLVLPASRPPSLSTNDDPRHFTLLTEKEQSDFFKKRQWKIVKKFKHATGPNKANWIGYVVQLP